MTASSPAAHWVGPRWRLAGAGIALLAFIGWGIAQLAALLRGISGGGEPLAVMWLLALALLWWVPLSWLERPITLGRHGDESVGRLRVAVQIPVYNEDEAALRNCLRSVLEQSRQPDKILVVNDGSMDARTSKPIRYESTRLWFLAESASRELVGRWISTPNQGKRFAQMTALASDDSDIFVTVDSDSVLDRHAIEEGIKPFHDPRVQSVAGSILALNGRRNALTALISALYVPFTRGFRSAQSVLGHVMVNSGTLAFYRADLVRRRARSYLSERFAGHLMQMNDDSMLTLYAMLDGKTVHQPTSFAFTLVPENWTHYRAQALRWMRGTFVRTLWWLRYMPLTSPAFWMPLAELAQLVLGIIFAASIGIRVAEVETAPQVLLVALAVTVAMNYLIALRYLTVRRDDEPCTFTVLVFLLAPLAGIWRVAVLRPLQVYAIATCWRVTSWGTRGTVEVRADATSSR